MKKIIVLLTLLAGLASMALGQKSFSQEGLASYYADKFQGRTTASGDRYDKAKFTCAHMSLPFGTELLVTNLENGKQTTVQVNDRGPFVANRIIDLSRAAAEEIDMVKSGVAKVKVEIASQAKSEASASQTSSKPAGQTAARPKPQKAPAAKPTPRPTPKPTPASQSSAYSAPREEGDMELFGLEVKPLASRALTGYGVQIASYNDQSNMLRRASELEQRFRHLLKVEIISGDDSKSYKLIIGLFPTKAEAQKYRAQLQAVYPDCFIISL
ncbi:MAG: hypothetical protein CSA97_02580 [Bacteroidetes bacterium]|nr:MAG: hypothetical protein CSA97_02580 [Bacteroidota bacterium]